VNSRLLDFGVFSMSVEDGWEDITASLEDADAPLTVADPVSGVGALQFSPAIYRSGVVPRVTPQDLCKFLDEFAFNQGLGEPFDRSSYAGEVAIEGASFHADSDLVRVWYISDGKSLILVTYLCDWDDRDREASEQETAVRSIRFA
jgi:hypothetical protein